MELKNNESNDSLNKIDSKNHIMKDYSNLQP